MLFLSNCTEKPLNITQYEHIWVGNTAYEQGSTIAVDVNRKRIYETRYNVHPAHIYISDYFGPIKEKCLIDSARYMSTAIAVDPKGDIFVGTWNSYDDNDDAHYIYKLSPNGATLGSFKIESVAFDYILGLTCDMNGILYALLERSGVYKFGNDGKLLAHWNNCLGLGISCDRLNQVYISDDDDNVIKKLNSKGEVAKKINLKCDQYSYVHGIAISLDDIIYVVLKTAVSSNKIQSYNITDGTYITEHNDVRTSSGWAVNPETLAIDNTNKILWVADHDGLRCWFKLSDF